MNNVVSGSSSVAKKGLSLPEERRKSSMVVSGGGFADAFGKGGGGKTLEGGVAGDGDQVFLENTNAAQVKATLAGEPINMIAQGKIIDAVLETAINSDLSGIIRAVVSRDVYAEAGKRILIPKGSRLVGSYDISVKRGQSRVFIIWNRVLRPDGVDVVITSPGSDRLGRAGVEGVVDGKYLDIFSNAILFSSITVAFAFAAESAINSDGLSEKENTSGSVTTSGSPSDIAVVESIGDFGDVVSNVASEVVDLRPTITIDQGTRMKVFVNKDLKFPSIFQSDVVFIK
jgi:type IV secretion system protein VirB10